MPTIAARLRRPPAPAQATERGATASVRAARRWFLIVAPVLAGLLAIVGAVADPAVGENGRALYEAYANDPDGVQIKAFGYHFGYALWGAAALLLAGLVRARGGWLANLAGVLALLGLTTLPGFVLADFYDSAIGQTFGADGAVRVEDAMEGMWALVAIGATGTAGFLLALPVAAIAAWRARLLPWWGALAPIVAVVVGFGALGATVPGTIVLAAGFAVLSVALARLDPRAWDGAARDGRPAVAA